MGISEGTISGGLEVLTRLPTFQDILDESGAFEITKYASRMGFSSHSRMAVMPGLLRYMIPRSEDEVKGYTMMDRIEQLVSTFKVQSRGVETSDMVFELKIPTFIEVDDLLEPEVRRRAIDRRVRVHASMIPESSLLLKRPAILFGIKD